MPSRSWAELRFPPFPHLEQLSPPATPIGDTWTGFPTLSTPTAKSGAGLDGSPITAARQFAGLINRRPVLEFWSMHCCFLSYDGNGPLLNFVLLLVVMIVNNRNLSRTRHDADHLCLFRPRLLGTNDQWNFDGISRAEKIVVCAAVCCATRASITPGRSIQDIRPHQVSAACTE